MGGWSHEAFCTSLHGFARSAILVEPHFWLERERLILGEIGRPMWPHMQWPPFAGAGGPGPGCPPMLLMPVMLPWGMPAHAAEAPCAAFPPPHPCAPAAPQEDTKEAPNEAYTTEESAPSSLEEAPVEASAAPPAAEAPAAEEALASVPHKGAPIAMWNSLGAKAKNRAMPPPAPPKRTPPRFPPPPPPPLARAKVKDSIETITIEEDILELIEEKDAVDEDRHSSKGTKKGGWTKRGTKHRAGKKVQLERIRQVIAEFVR